MSRIITLVLGYFFLILGVIGLVLPFLQGVPFIVIGLLLLSREAAWARRALDWLKRRHPRLESMITRSDAWITRQMRQARVRIGRWFRPAVR
jgi:uncharacterized membrane protein YbaN (DUF454 family)